MQRGIKMKMFGIKKMIIVIRKNDYSDDHRNHKLNHRNQFTKKRRAQSILEYSILIAVVTAALISMSLYVKRAIQANLKTIENQINAEVSEPE